MTDTGARGAAQQLALDRRPDGEVVADDHHVHVEVDRVRGRGGHLHVAEQQAELRELVGPVGSRV